MIQKSFFNQLWRGVYGTEEEEKDSFRKYNKINLDYFPSAMKPMFEWESSDARSHCLCCTKNWSKSVLQYSCNFCGRLVCGSEDCSLLNVSVKRQPWLRSCKPCWFHLLAIIKSGEVQAWELVKAHVSLNGEVDIDFEMVEGGEIEQGQLGDAFVTVNVQSTRTKSVAELVSRIPSPNVNCGQVAGPVSSSPGGSTDGLEQEVQRLKLETKALLAAKTTLEQTLTATELKRKETEKRADELLARAGKAHIKRDWRRMDNPSQFPAGDDLKDAFQTPFLQFECFACDVITSLGSLGRSEEVANGLLVSQLMKPMYDVTHNYVTNLLREKEAAMQATFNESVPTDLTHDTITKLFWFTRMQELVPAQIAALPEEVIVQLMRDMGDLVPAVHAQMLLDGENNVISNTPNDLRVPGIVRTLLRLFSFVMLSDPNCYLQPAPGTTVAYHPDRCHEILSPGTRKHGQIKEGDEVEVVLCGLYFEDTASEEGAFERVRPVVKCCVRRMVNKKK